MARLLGAEADGEVGGAPAAPVAVGRRAVVRSGEGDQGFLPSGSAQMMGGDLTRKAFTPMIVEVQARNRDDHGGFQRDEGEAWLMVQEGELALHSELYSPLHLKAGDAAYFDARAAYALLNEHFHDIDLPLPATPSVLTCQENRVYRCLEIEWQRQHICERQHFAHAKDMVRIVFHALACSSSSITIVGMLGYGGTHKGKGSRSGGLA